MRTIEEQRLKRGLRLWRAGLVSPNGTKGQYYVASQSGNGRYLAATAWADCGRRCSCPDYKKRGLACKHIAAAELAEAAERIGRKVEAGVSLEHIQTELMLMGCAGVPDRRLAKWEVLWIVANELAGKPVI